MTAPYVPSPGYPVAVRGWVQPDLHRWKWLIKWFLAIPHLVVLTFLWLAFLVLTVVAFFSIAFTGRYPRSIFDFNVGVLRWTWRVDFYAFTLASDHYPPFSLDRDPSFPAELEVEYPEQLSKGLVWVKWWLLAIPHLVLVGIFVGGANFGSGLVGVLSLIAGVILAFTGVYPRTIFDFVMGLHRWAWRVTAYVALMRDEYPPFRLDTGPDEPDFPPRAAVVTPERPASPASTGTFGGFPGPAVPT
jgi:hypothetical protein